MSILCPHGKDLLRSVYLSQVLGGATKVMFSYYIATFSTRGVTTFQNPSNTQGTMRDFSYNMGTSLAKLFGKR